MLLMLQGNARDNVVILKFATPPRADDSAHCKSGLNDCIFSRQLFDSCSQHLEIFFLPAVPTECLDRKLQPQIPMTLHTVVVCSIIYLYTLMVECLCFSTWCRGKLELNLFVSALKIEVYFRNRKM